MIRFASLDEAWGSPPKAPLIENPYKSEPYHHITPSVDMQDACHKHIMDIYDQQGIQGVVRALPPEIVARIKALASPLLPGQRYSPTLPFNLTIEEMLLLAIGAFALLMALDSD